MRISATVSAAALLVGCATPAHIPTWAHPDLPKDSERTKDLAMLNTAECYQQARGMVPQPAAPRAVPVPPPSSYTTTGTYTNYGGIGVINATTRPQGGFSQGLASGANLGAAVAHNKAVSDANQQVMALTGACMRMRGWIDISTPEGRNKLRATSTPSTGAFDDLPDKAK